LIRRVLITVTFTLLGAACAMKSDVADLESTLQAQMQAERAQRDSLMTEIRQLRSVLLDSLSVQQRRDTAGAALAGGADGETPVSTATDGQPEALYEAALRQFRRGSYETARAGLDEFLEQYPSHELAPDAQYFRAETFAEAGGLDEALEEYARVLELYPNSRRAPTALYKSGLIELQKGNVDDARTYFQRVVQGYPDSDEIDLAERELTRLQN